MSLIAEQMAGRDATQEKTFKNWVNLHLQRARVQTQINDIDADLVDGSVLCLLAEVFVPKDQQLKFYPNAGNNNLKRTQNNDLALTRFAHDGVELFNIHASSLASDQLSEKTKKLKMGMIFQLILAYSISQDAAANDVAEQKKKSLAELKQNLIDWVNEKLATLSPEQVNQIRKFNGQEESDEALRITNLDEDWANGNALAGLVVALHPDDRKQHGINKLNELKSADSADTAALQSAITRAQNNLTCPPLIDADDMQKHPDANSVLTYVSQFKNAVYVDDYEEEVSKDAEIVWDEPTFLTIEVEALEAGDLTPLEEQKQIIEAKLNEYEQNKAEEKIYKESCHRKAKRMQLHLRRVNAAIASDEANKNNAKTTEDELNSKQEENQKLADDLAKATKDLEKLQKRQSKLGELQKKLLEVAEISDEMLADEEQQQ
eukprot:UN02111